MEDILVRNLKGEIYGQALHTPKVWPLPMGQIPEEKWELRGVNDQFNRETVREGRRVELRKGYSGESIWGAIDRVETFGNLEDVAENLDFRAIIPPVESRNKFLSRAKGLLSEYDEFIAFKILFDG